MTDSIQLQKTPCYNCLVRSMCRNRKIIICGELAAYVSPKQIVIRIRLLRIRRILPRVDYIRRPEAGWLDIPGYLIRKAWFEC